MTAVIFSFKLLVTIYSMMVIEKVGRRSLLLTSQTVMAAGAFLVFALGVFLPNPVFLVGSLMLFMVGFGIGLGSIPW